MARSIHLNIQVLYNGVTIESHKISTSSSTSIYLWQLFPTAFKDLVDKAVWKQKVAKIHRKGVTVFSKNPLEFSVLSPEDFKQIQTNKKKKTSCSHIIKPEESVKISHKGLTVLFKVEIEALSTYKFNPSHYKSSPFSLSFEDQASFAVFTFSVLLCSIMCAVLYYNIKEVDDNFKRPTAIYQLQEEQVIGFFDPTSLKTAPEALKKNLDRGNYLKSNYNYYSSLMGLLLDKDTVQEKNVLL